MKHTTLKYFKLFLFYSLLFSYNLSIAQAAKKNIVVSENSSPNSFPIFSNTAIPTFYCDANDAKVVQISAEAFANDFKLISGKSLKVKKSNPVSNQYSIIAGTIGKCKIIDDLIKAKQINIDAIKNKWECFSIQILNKTKLIIVGSDRRGTAFGIFYLSKLMGVSPLVYWADVVPQKKSQLFISGAYISKEPSVKYRGIFINDEDWGMQPWAAKNMDTTIKDIGPKTYAKVFELLLRLKANYIWPAMHPCTKAFYYYKENPKVADDYAIVVGSSHAEPMLRNNVFEWAVNFENEYGKKPGEWRYDVNKEQIYNYWNDRVKEAIHYESVFTVGMRGVHDSGMPGPENPDEKVKLLENIISDQRHILHENFKKLPSEIPQIFIPYKEVLSLYRRNMKLPGDITIIWPDDNYGYIRQLPNEMEQKRSGGNGVYYHLSYWGSPADYLWLCTTSPALIGYQMKKAYNYNAKKLWVFNVGDIKPAELEIQFALDMAYDLNVYDEENPLDYITRWATAIFGKDAGKEIAVIKQKFYQLAQEAKPEHLDMVHFTTTEAQKRLEDYNELENLVLKTEPEIPSQLSDAFYQLIKYPTTSARLMNQKFTFNHLAQLAFNDSNIAQAKAYTSKATLAYDSIKLTTKIYNEDISKGKWNGMMSYHPRDLKVFAAPPSFDSLKYNLESAFIKKEIEEKKLIKRIGARDLFEHGKIINCKLLPNLGISDASITALDISKIAEITYSINLPVGNYKILVKCLPTYAMEKDKKLTYSIAINNDTPQIINVNAETESAIWKKNVVNGFSLGVSNHKVSRTAKSTLNLVLQNKNLVINQIEIYKN
jgi:hypothetical protein